MMLAPAAKTFVWFVALCICLEMGARFFYPLSSAHQDAPAKRNETTLRNWPEYIAGSADHDQLMVYISNSQAVGIEYADSRQIYPSLMRDSLRHSTPKLRLENWALTGMNAEQIELFTLQAVERNARYMVIAVSLINFDNKRNYRFGRDRSDLSLLVGKASFWLALHQTFIGSFIDWDERLSNTVSLYSRAGRLRSVFLDHLAAKVERRWHQVLFGHLRSRSALKRIDEQTAAQVPDQNAEIRKVTNPMSAENWEKSFRSGKLPRLKAVYTHLRARLNEHDIKLLWIWVPVGANKYNQGAIEGQKPIIGDFCAQVIEDGWGCEDLTEALPASGFLPSTFSSHLNLQGHQLQAELITPILRRAIH